MQSSTFGLALAPLLPWPWLAGLGAVALALVAWGLYRRARGILLRAIALAALLTVLANPQVIEETHAGLPDVALVVVDGSASMDIAQRRGQAAAVAGTLVRRLERERGLEVRLVEAGARVGAGVGGGAGAGGSAAGDGGGTRLFAALDRALADVPRQRLAGAVLITDGQVHDAPRADDGGPPFPAPLHVLLTGAPGESDRRLEPAETPAFALVGKAAPLAVTVVDPALPAGSPLTLTATLEDGTVLAVPAAVGRPAMFTLPVRHAGLNVVDIAVPERPGELSPHNNRLALSVSGVRDRLRVLLISGEPHLGERAWRNLLKADPNVDLVHFTILRPPTKDDGTPLSELALIAFPIRELFHERLADFDLVIFDRYSRQGLVPSTFLGNIADYVRGGGALLAAVGPEYAGATSLWDSPLAAVLPAAPTGAAVDGPFRPLPSAGAGLRHPVTAGLPGAEADRPAAAWGRWLRRVPAEAQRGHVVMDAGDPSRPLVVLDRVGEGRSALVLSDTLWLWARGFEGGGPQVELVRRLAHWLMAEPDLEEEALAAQVEDGRLRIERRTLAVPPADSSAEAGNAPPPVALITGPDDRVRAAPLREEAPGRWRATVAADRPGLYRVEAGGLTAVAAAGEADPLEARAMEATDAVLGPVARMAGGGVFWLGAGPEAAVLPEVRRVEPGTRAAGADWLGLRANSDHVVTGIRQAPLLGAGMALALVLAALLAAWWREGR